MNFDWAPSYLVRWLFDQGNVWIKADGTPVSLVAMDYDHALNTLLMIERVSRDIDEHLRGQRVQDTVLYAALRERVVGGEDGEVANARILGTERRLTEPWANLRGVRRWADE